MNRRFAFVLLVLIIPLVLIQFIPVHLPANSMEVQGDLLITEDVPDDVSRLLKAGCYDCHSQQVSYPWYSYIAPMSWLVAEDVKAGISELNFSAWDTLSKRKKIGVLTDIAEQVEREEMPLPMYTILHPEARFSTEERARIIEWTDVAASEILGD